MPPLRLVPLHAWRKEVNALPPSNPLFPLRDTFAGKSLYFPYRDGAHDCTNTKALAESFGVHLHDHPQYVASCLSFLLANKQE